MRYIEAIEYLRQLSLHGQNANDVNDVVRAVLDAIDEDTRNGSADDVHETILDIHKDLDEIFSPKNR